MIKPMHVFTLLFFIACNNQKKSGYVAVDANLKDTAVHEQGFITLGEQQQYVEITGASSTKPVLLFLHGGPGWPQTPHLRYFNSDLTRSMILVSWDQAGCGKSFINDSTPANLSLEQLVSDAHELTQLLKKKFHKDKIYLAGFSWGSILGMHLVNKYPGDYAAYFGISQVIDMNRSVEVSREWIRQQAEMKKDKKMLSLVAQLEKKDTNLCKNPLDCFFKKYEMLTEYGGAIYKKESEAEIKIAETKYEDYKNYDWLKGFMYSASRLGDAIFETDFTHITQLKLPVYFLLGRHDRSLPAIVTANFYDRLAAPKKELIWFEQSGHECLEEESATFNKVIVERIKN